MGEKVIAQIVLRSADGRSIKDAEGPLTAQTIDQFKVEEQVIAEATTRLEALGLKVVSSGPVSLTIEADRTVFESVFQTRLAVEAAAGEKAAWRPGPQKLAEPARVPDELSHLVAEVVLPQPPELFP